MGGRAEKTTDWATLQKRGLIVSMLKAPSYLLYSFLLLLPFLLECDAAKGGAKSMMGRRKNQAGSTNTHSGYHGHNSQIDRQLEEFDGSGDDYDDEGEPPCIGLCLMRKRLGQEPPPPVLTKPCVGKCQHRRQHGLKEPPKRKRRKPCVGLCYIRKLKAAEERRRRKEEKEKREN